MANPCETLPSLPPKGTLPLGAALMKPSLSTGQSHLDTIYHVNSGLPSGWSPPYIPWDHFSLLVQAPARGLLTLGHKPGPGLSAELAPPSTG